MFEEDLKKTKDKKLSKAKNNKLARPRTKKRTSNKFE